MGSPRDAWATEISSDRDGLSLQATALRSVTGALPASCYNGITLFRKQGFQSSRCGAVEVNPTGNREVAGSIPGLTQWVKDLVLP